MSMTRLEVQDYLESLAQTRNVYFQPPASVRMKYPAIVYMINDIANDHADNLVYRQDREYQLTVIDFDPDSVLADAVSKIPRCRFIRSFAADNLNHWIFTVIF